MSKLALKSLVKSKVFITGSILFSILLIVGITYAITCSFQCEPGDKAACSLTAVENTPR